MKDKSSIVGALLLAVFIAAASMFVAIPVGMLFAVSVAPNEVWAVWFAVLFAGCAGSIGLGLAAARASDRYAVANAEGVS